MAVADGKSILYGVNFCAISPLLTDPAGGVATYGSAIQLPGIISVGVTPEFIEAKLKGDEAILDYFSKLQNFKLMFENAVVSQAAMATFLGSTIINTGTTPNTQQTLRIKSTDVAGYFKLEVQILYVGGSKAGQGADFHDIFYKAKLSNFKIEKANEKYATVSFDAMAIGRSSDNVMWDMIENETSVAVPVAAAGAAPTLVSTSPASGAAGVSINVTPSWTFSGALAPSSATDPANFMVVAAVAGTQVAGTLAYNANSFAVTFTPSAALTVGTQYLMTASQGVRDVFGNRFAGDVRKFNT